MMRERRSQRMPGVRIHWIMESMESLPMEKMRRVAAAVGATTAATAVAATAVAATTVAAVVFMSFMEQQLIILLTQMLTVIQK
jgi:hypothetical protein